MQLSELIQSLIEERGEDRSLTVAVARRLSESGPVVYGGAVWTGTLEDGKATVTESVEEFERQVKPEDGWSTTEIDKRVDAELARRYGFQLASEIAV